MVARPIAWMLVCATLPGLAQDSEPFVAAGLLRVSAAISPGVLLNAPGTNIYLNGRLEYFPEDRISFRGEVFWYRGSQERTGSLTRNDQVAVGPFYHWLNDRLDLALGMEAGVSLAQPAQLELENGASTDPLRVIPNVALCGGLTYTVWDHFHFFLDARLVHARYTGAVGGSIPLDEVIMGGGLGWQFRR